MDMQTFSLYLTLIFFLPQSLFGFVLRKDVGENANNVQQNSLVKFRRSLTKDSTGYVMAKVESSDENRDHLENLKRYLQLQETRAKERRKPICKRHPYLCDLAWPHAR